MSKRAVMIASQDPDVFHTSEKLMDLVKEAREQAKFFKKANDDLEKKVQDSAKSFSDRSRVIWDEFLDMLSKRGLLDEWKYDKKVEHFEVADGVLYICKNNTEPAMTELSGSEGVSILKWLTKQLEEQKK